MQLLLNNKISKDSTIKCNISKSLSVEPDLKALTEFEKEKPQRAKKANPLLPELREELKRVYRDPDYWMNDISNVVRLTNGSLLYFEKPQIKTSFCFGYSDFGQGFTEDEADHMADIASKNANYFINSNLRDLQEDIDHLEAGDDLYIYHKYCL